MKFVEYFEIISMEAATAYKIIPLPSDSHRLTIGDLFKIRKGIRDKTIYYRDIGIDSKYFFSTPGDKKGQFTYVEFFTDDHGKYEAAEISFQTATASMKDQRIFTSLATKGRKSANLQQPTAILNAIVACVKHFHERKKRIQYYFFHGVKEGEKDEKGNLQLSSRTRIYVRMLAKMGIKKIFISKKEFNNIIFSLNSNAEIPSDDYEELK